jgi:hypothetical protein
VARPSGCGVENRLDAFLGLGVNPQASVETSLDAADTECPRHGLQRLLDVVGGYFFALDVFVEPRHDVLQALYAVLWDARP